MTGWERDIGRGGGRYCNPTLSVHCMIESMIGDLPILGVWADR
jgi:hypothetical protein